VPVAETPLSPPELRAAESPDRDCPMRASTRTAAAQPISHGTPALRCLLRECSPPVSAVAPLSPWRLSRLPFGCSPHCTGPAASGSKLIGNAQASPRIIVSLDSGMVRRSIVARDTKSGLTVVANGQHGRQSWSLVCIDRPSQSSAWAGMSCGHDADLAPSSRLVGVAVSTPSSTMFHVKRRNGTLVVTVVGEAGTRIPFTRCMVSRDCQCNSEVSRETSR